MKLSVVIPVYNEKKTIRDILERVKATPYDKEIIVVDDCSTDGTSEILACLADEAIRVFQHGSNQGKGAAIQTGLQHVTGDIVMFQDADLEYDPKDYPLLITPILEGKTAVAYGTRFHKDSGGSFVVHYWGNRFLTWVTNLLYHSSLSDMESGYKAFKAEVLKDVRLKSHRFDMEPEITAKVLKRGHRILEVPISYNGRTYEQGKKIRMKDGIAALYALIKFRFVD